MRRIGLLIGLVAISLGLLTGPAQAAPRTTSGVIPPGSHAFGHTYGEWSAQWWRWAFQLPVHGPRGAVHQLAAPNGALDCSYGQSGKVWFLAGTFSADASTPTPGLNANRRCTIPSGTALLFPVVNAEADNIDPSGSGQSLNKSLATLRADAAANMDAVRGSLATIDGRPVARINDYRVVSPVFNYKLPKDNIVSFANKAPFPPVATPRPGAVADGIFVLLAPLPVGKHTLHWEGGIPDAFTQNITYTITVTPDHR
jgi:hypothetical protein